MIYIISNIYIWIHILDIYIQNLDFPGGSVVKNLPAGAGDTGLIPKIPWKRARHPSPVFLPGKSHGQRSLVGYSPRGCKRIRHDLATKQEQQSNIHWEIVRRNVTWGTMGDLGKSPPPSLCGCNSFSLTQDEPEAPPSLSAPSL